MAQPNALPAPATATDTARQAAVVAALVVTLATNTLANTRPPNGRTTGEISAQFPLQITPPGFTFGIWGLIYSGLIGYAVYQALPAQRANRRLRRIGWPFVLSCAANIAWLLLWHSGRYRLTLAAMVALLLALIVIDARVGRGEPAPLAERLLARGPFSIYLGWISVATLINATVALYDAGWDGAGLSAEVWTSGLVGLGAALGATLGLARREAALPLTVAWALLGIALKQADTPLVAPMAWAGAAAALAAAAGGPALGAWGVHTK